MRSHEERRCSNLGPTQSRISQSIRRLATHGDFREVLERFSGKVFREVLEKEGEDGEKDRMITKGKCSVPSTQSYVERELSMKLFGNEVYHTACSLLVILKNSCIKLHCQNDSI